MIFKKDFNLNLSADNKLYAAKPAVKELPEENLNFNLVNGDNINANNEYSSELVSENNAASDFVSSLNQEDKDLSIRAMEYVLKKAELAMKDIKRNNGDVKKAWDYIKNTFGLEYGSDAIQGRIDLARQEIEDVKNGKLDLGKVYKKLTGNELNADELERLKNPAENPDADKNDGVTRPNYKIDFSNAPSHKDAAEYEAGQNQALETAAVITGAASIAAAPVTGGTSLLIGTAGYTGVKAADGLTRETYYSGSEAVSDIVKGAVSAGSTLTGMKLGEAASGLLGRLGASLTIGVGNTGGNYIADKLLKGEEINSEELKEILESSAAASVLGYLAGIGANQVISRFLALGAGTGSQVLNRLLAAGITGGAAGGGAAAGAGGANYIINYLKDENAEFNMKDFLAACGDNVPQGITAGIAGGVLYEGAGMLRENLGARLNARSERIAAEKKPQQDLKDLKWCIKNKQFKDMCIEKGIYEGSQKFNEILELASKYNVTPLKVLEAALYDSFPTEQALLTRIRTPEQTYKELAEYKPSPELAKGLELHGVKPLTPGTEEFQIVVDFTHKFGLTAEQAISLLDNGINNMKLLAERDWTQPSYRKIQSSLQKMSVQDFLIQSKVEKAQRMISGQQ